MKTKNINLSYKQFGKFFEQKNIDLLRAIKHNKPHSIHELARLSDRDVESVNKDVKYLAALNVFKLKSKVPKIEYDVLNVRIDFD